MWKKAEKNTRGIEERVICSTTYLIEFPEMEERMEQKNIYI